MTSARRRDTRRRPDVGPMKAFIGPTSGRRRCFVKLLERSYRHDVISTSYRRRHDIVPIRPLQQLDKTPTSGRRHTDEGLYRADVGPTSGIPTSGRRRGAYIGMTSARCWNIRPTSCRRRGLTSVNADVDPTSAFTDVRSDVVPMLPVGRAKLAGGH
jgi:hypothetical protein